MKKDRMPANTESHIKLGWALMFASLIPVFMIGRASWNYVRSADWVEVDAKIVSVDLRSSSNSSRRSSPRLSVEYEFDWNGEQFQSESVSPFNSIEFLITLGTR